MKPFESYFNDHVIEKGSANSIDGKKSVTRKNTNPNLCSTKLSISLGSLKKNEECVFKSLLYQSERRNQSLVIRDLVKKAKEQNYSF